MTQSTEVAVTTMAERLRQLAEIVDDRDMEPISVSVGICGTRVHLEFDDFKRIFTGAVVKCDSSSGYQNYKLSRDGIDYVARVPLKDATVERVL